MNFGNFFVLSILLLSGVLSGCNFFISTGELPDNQTGLVAVSSPESYSSNKILFAHGYHDNASAWDTFNNYMKDYHSDWVVYSTNTDPKGSIEKRGGELADYINSLNLEDNSLICVGHSMGGLDLRYIVSMGHTYASLPENENYKFYLAAKKIHKIYTLSSPHRGNQFGGTLHLDDGAISLGITQMRSFNLKHHYGKMVIDDRKIPLLAMRFHCLDAEYSDGNGGVEPPNELDSDGTVAVIRQILYGAPFTQSIFHGRHTMDAPNECTTLDVETKSVSILEDILNNTQYYADVKDIVFYEHTSCDGDEKGDFSSAYKPGDINCKENDRCDNDEIASVMLYPGIKPNTVIKLYDSEHFDENDDFIRIHIGEDFELLNPVCLWDLEHSYDSFVKGVTVDYYGNNGLNGKVSAVKIFESTLLHSHDIVFYENDDCTGDIDGTFESRDSAHGTNCKESSNCINDEIQSIKLLSGVPKDTIIKLYNDPDGEEKYGWAEIKVTKTLTESYCVKFDKDSDYKDVEVDFTKHSNFCAVNCDVPGNVSYIYTN